MARSHFSECFGRLGVDELGVEVDELGLGVDDSDLGVDDCDLEVDDFDLGTNEGCLRVKFEGSIGVIIGGGVSEHGLVGGCGVSFHDNTLVYLSSSASSSTSSSLSTSSLASMIKGISEHSVSIITLKRRKNRHLRSSSLLTVSSVSSTPHPELFTKILATCHDRFMLLNLSLILVILICSEFWKNWS